MLILCIINPRRMRRRVTVVVMYTVITFNAKLASTYLVYTSKIQCHRVLRGVFKVFTVCVSLKTLCSTVLVSFADFPRSLTSSRWTLERASNARLLLNATPGCVHSAISPRT